MGSVICALVLVYQGKGRSCWDSESDNCGIPWGCTSCVALLLFTPSTSGPMCLGADYLCQPSSHTQRTDQNLLQHGFTALFLLCCFIPCTTFYSVPYSDILQEYLAAHNNSMERQHHVDAFHIALLFLWVLAALPKLQQVNVELQAEHDAVWLAEQDALRPAETEATRTAGAVKPGTSSSVEIFPADLLIPQPGLRVAFTFQPTMPFRQMALELWCWMEASNSSSGSALTATGSAATDGLLTEVRARADEPTVRVLMMLQFEGRVVVTDEQAPGCTTGQASRPVAEL